MLDELIQTIIATQIPERNSILFIDDEAICHDIVNLVLRYSTNYNVINAYSGKEALALAQQFNKKLGLIFIDILLSDMNGYQIYKLIRENEVLANIPIVFQSGVINQISEINQLIIGKEVDIIHKPYKNDELINIVNKYMRKKAIT